MNETGEHWRSCDMEGCDYVAEGRTMRETTARMVSHFSRKDHLEHVKAILADGSPS